MKKNILIIHSNMELGGAETSLLGLLEAFDYSKVNVDLLLLNPVGELLADIPQQVNLLERIPSYQALVISIKDALKRKHFLIASTRLWSKLIFYMMVKKNPKAKSGYTFKQIYYRNALALLPRLPKSYDLGISFNDPHYILQYKVNSELKLGWFHTDYSIISAIDGFDISMWGGCDYIINVSQRCKDAFDLAHPTLKNKSIIIENILNIKRIMKKSIELNPDNEMEHEGICVLSIGRFCDAKNFDNVPDICSRIRALGLNVKWYLIGFGGDEELIKQKIQEAGMQDYVIILGKKDNPYPYIAACDLYVQPSRYEGKCVTVREAQILCKPVVITNYVTSVSQLEDGVDGVIVPMDNEGCAKGIAELLFDPEKMKRLAENCKLRDYSNAQEVDKIYQLME